MTAEADTVLDLAQRHFSRELGPVTLIGTWLATDDGVIPCLAIIRRGEERNEHTIPCVVTLDHAYLFDRSSHKMFPDWARRAVLMCHGFVHALRLETEPHAIQQLCELVEDHIDDLFGIPPYTPPPLTSEEAVAEVTITHRSSGKRVREALV